MHLIRVTNGVVFLDVIQHAIHTYTTMHYRTLLAVSLASVACSVEKWGVRYLVLNINLETMLRTNVTM